MATSATTSTAQVQAELQEVQKVMETNINMVIERGENLEDLQQKTEELQVSGQQFNKAAKEAHKKMWWEDTKMKIWIGIAVVCLLALIIGLAVGLSKK